MRDDVTLQRLLRLVGCMHKMIPGVESVTISCDWVIMLSDQFISIAMTPVKFQNREPSSQGPI